MISVAEPTVGEAETDRVAAVLESGTLADDAEVRAFELEPVALDAVSDLSSDGIIVAIPHDEFDRIQWTELSTADGRDSETGTTSRPVVIDGRGAVEEPPDSLRVYEIGGGRRE